MKTWDWLMRKGEWSTDNKTKEASKPKVSEESQFHHPPQVPSCSAHQLPIHKPHKFKIVQNHADR